MSSSNSVTITSSRIQSISFIDNSVVASAGVSHDNNISISQNGDVWTLTLNCDRHGTADVAQKFVTACGGSAAHMLAFANNGSNSTFADSTPSALNFYFAVQILGQTIYLAQGHYSTNNNWWIGGSCIVRDLVQNSGLSYYDNASVVVGNTTIPLYAGNSNFSF